VQLRPNPHETYGSEWATLATWSGLEDFDRYATEHNIPKEDWPAAFALWLAETTGGPVPRFEKVEREEPADGVVIEGHDL
jgi:hypothetical protein